MGENSGIQWTHHWVGCAKVSAECKHCYAEVETFARRNRANGLELWGPNAHRHVTSDANWRKPIAWNNAAAKAGERHRVFCASMADVFEDRPDLIGARAELWALVHATPHLDWLLLTKRPENADRLWRAAAENHVGLEAAHGDRPGIVAWLPNIWLGTSVGTQATADERIPHLLRVPARVRFLSCEPLLEPVNFGDALCEQGYESNGPQGWVQTREHGIDWVIVGGESGPKARPCDVRWIREIVEQCRRAGVAPFVKQLGARPCSGGLPERRLDPYGSGMFAHVVTDEFDNYWAVYDKKGGVPEEWPDYLRVRELPEVRRGG